MPSRLTLVLVSLLLATPAVSFWLWLVIVPARVAVLCPEGCTCDIGGYKVVCSGSSSNPVNLIHLTNVQQLVLFDNKIGLLQKDSFVLMTELGYLSLNYCKLRTIEVGAFNGLTKLRVLSIFCSKLSELLTDAFENMISLVELDLSGNKIEHLDGDVFSGLVKLKYIDLSQNKLQYLHPDTFLGLPNLQQLELGSNSGLQIPTDHNFINSHSLSKLDISLCNISSLSVETFTNVSALEWLDLGHNKLKTIDINILTAVPKLSTLRLYGNPLQCDCELQEVWRWCEDHNIQTVYGVKPECDTPIEVKGMWWGVLEKGQCLQGNIQFYGDYKSESKNYNHHWENKYHHENKNVDILKQYQVEVNAVPFVFGTAGNVILLIITICNKNMRTLPNIYILNLALSDIVYLAVLFSEACANRLKYTWIDVEFMCRFLAFCRRMSVGLSAYSVALYSFQRYRVTVKPFQVRVSSQTAWRGIVAEICAVWILAALFAVPSTLSNNLCTRFVTDNLITYYQHVVIFELLVSCVLPLCVIAFSYIMTARHLAESSRAISEGTQNPQINTRRNIAKIVVGLTVVFVISIVPYHVFWSYFICSQKNIFSYNTNDILNYLNYKLQYTYVISNCFLLINPCLNPVALFCTSSPFRQHVKRYLTCFCKTNSPPTDLELARRN